MNDFPGTLTATIRYGEVRFCFFLLSVFLTGNSLVADVDFSRDILPILSDRCFNCHGPSEEHREGSLRLDQPEGDDGALRTLDGLSGIKPGDPDTSEVWHRITTDDEDLQMPPADSGEKAISPKEQTLLKQWILEGAKYNAFWSFVAPKHSPQPEVANESWRHNIIDSFVKAQLQEESLQPKDEADKPTLIRRVTLDLTGLPPSISEIGTFLKDQTGRAFRVIYREEDDLREFV